MSKSADSSAQSAAVASWLERASELELKLSAETKANVRDILSTLYTHASVIEAPQISAENEI